MTDREWFLAIGGPILGALISMVVSAFTVYRRLDQVLLTMATKEQLNAAIIEVRHGMRNEVQAVIARIELEVTERMDRIETRLRDLELSRAKGEK